LIAVLAVKVEDIFDGPEVTVFVLLSGCVFDVVEVNSCSPAVVTAVRVSVLRALEALVTVAVSVFLATERLDGSRVEALSTEPRRGSRPVLRGGPIRYSGR